MDQFDQIAALRVFVECLVEFTVEFAPVIGPYGRVGELIQLFAQGGGAFVVQTRHCPSGR
ncbi:Uncharacterised protein [Mycobacteroides abscessus subsp. abscessus]|nr:Uncharacterised protein [Mycobacteroides abscessus subsp. abscessus]